MDRTVQRSAIDMTWPRRSVLKSRMEIDRLDFEALFNQHWEPLCRILCQFTGDEAEAEDLALEALLQLYHHPPADPSNLSGWLYRVATNLGLNALRARKRRERYETEAGDLALRATNPDDPAISLEKQLERQRVRNALQAIKPRSARILILRHSGLAYAEIAAALGIAPGSVGTLLVRAEKEFERAFEKLPL
jgi:RNA polymerase sigma-70 factor (ECF subfamily)